MNAIDWNAVLAALAVTYIAWAALAPWAAAPTIAQRCDDDEDGPR